MWKVVDTGKNLASKNMKIDAKMLEDLKPDDDPILHFYDWEKPAATYGYFIKPNELFRTTKDLDLSRRPTGGGVLFHLWDLAFSVLIPKEHYGYSNDIMRNYKFINDGVLLAIKEFFKKEGPINLLPEDPSPLDKYSKFFCFAKPTKYDVMFGGKKVAGAAQRRKKNGFLHQGSISIAMPDTAFLETLLPIDSRVIEAMLMHTFAPLPKGSLQSDIEEARESLKLHLQKTLTQL